MKFDNSHVRRQDRLLGEAEALEILRVGEYGYISMRDEEGGLWCACELCVGW